MGAEKWTNTFLDEMREAGDPPADSVVTGLFESGTYSAWDLMKTLVGNDYPAPDQLPPQLKDYLESTSRIPPVDQTTVAGGQRLFERCGPEILLVLACYSLPSSYAARKGVQVLYRTGYLNNRANHRLFETTQMVMDVMVPDGLNSSGRGVRSAQKIRLMHAAVRRLILTDAETPWDKDFGVPINQEDLAGTFLVFTRLIIDGLHRLGIVTSPEEDQGFLETWKVIGRLMGIQESMIPATMAEAKTLCDLIQTRQVQTCPEGKAMNDALLQMLEGKMPPGPWRSWPAALMRFFFPPHVADGFELPHHGLEERLLESASEFRNEIGTHDPRLWAIRKCALLVMQSFVSAELGGKRTPFILPTNLHHEWAKSHRISVWDQLRR